MAFYNSAYRMGTGAFALASGLRTKYDFQPRYEKHQRNLQRAEQEGWDDSKTGFVNKQGDFKPLASKRDDYRTPTTWGEAKKNMQKILNDNQDDFKRDLAITMERRNKEGAFNKASFKKFASGEHSLRQLGLMVSEQVPNMLGALLSFGALPALSEGASIYETLVRDAAKERYGLLFDEPTSEQMYQVLLDDTKNVMSSKAAASTVAIAGLEYIGARTMMPVYKDAVGSLLKGQFKRSLRGLANTGQRMALGGFTEGLTEGLQTAVSSMATGHWNAEEFTEAIGMGTVMGVIMPFGGSVVTQTSRELSQSVKMVASRYNKKVSDKMFSNHQSLLDEALKTGQIDMQEYKEKTDALASVRNSNNKIPSNLNEENRAKALDLLIEKDVIEKEVEGKDKNLVTKQTERIEAINNELVEISAKQVTETVKEQIKQSGLEGQVTEMTSEEISNIKEEGFDSKTAAGEFGFIKQGTDGSFEIVLNKDKPMVGTAAHEFMHAVLFKTIGGNAEIQNNLGDALVEHTSTLGGETSILGERLSAYGKWDGDTFVRDDNFGEETITIMSESIIDGSLKFNENFFTKIGDIVRRFSQKY